jgi:metallo-beta-lactamase class B
MQTKLQLLIALLWILVYNLSAQMLTEDISLNKIDENIYQYTAFTNDSVWGRIPANGMLIVDSGEAVLVNTPWNDSLTKILYNWVLDSLNTKITVVIPTHSHNDCMGGLNFLKNKNVVSYAHELTENIALETSLPLPDIMFSDTLRLVFFNTEIILKYIGQGHSKDNIVVWLPKTKILFAGCLVKSIKSKDLGNTADANIDEWPKTIIKMATKFKTALLVIPGHGDSGGPELLEHTLRLLRSKKK